MQNTLIPWGYIDDNGRKFYPIHNDQKIVLNSTARFTAAIAGTGGGKTVIGPIWMMKQIEKVIQRGEKFNGMVVAPTYKVLARATVPTLIETFKGTYLEGIYKEQKNVYVLPNEWGTIWCQGADNPGGLEGGQFHAVWGDEGGQFKFGVWVAIQGRTGAKQAPILITTTPYLRNWLFSEFYKKWKEGDPNYFVHQWSSFKNPAYPKEEYDRALRSMSPERAAMRYDGNFTYSEGLVYPFFHSCLVDNSYEEIISMGGRAFGGMDFGFNDPFAALSGILDEDDVLWIWYERYKSRTEIEAHADALPRFNDRTIKWYCEHQPEYLIKLRRGGHKCIKANKNIQVGIDAVTARINTGRLRVLQRYCPALIAESEVYCYPENDEQIVGDKPVDMDNHAMDALRYMITGIDVRKAA